MGKEFKKVVVIVAMTCCILTGLAAEVRTGNSAVAQADSARTAEAAETPSDAAVGPVYTGERISLDYQRADLRSVIRTIAGNSGKNVVISKAVKGKITLKLKDVPWDQALDIVLASQDLVVEESGNVLTIFRRSSFRNFRQTSD